MRAIRYISRRTSTRGSGLQRHRRRSHGRRRARADPDASCEDPADVDEDGHGTHVASTIGSPLTGVGMAGAAPRVDLRQPARRPGLGLLLPQPEPRRAYAELNWGLYPIRARDAFDGPFRTARSAPTTLVVGDALRPGDAVQGGQAPRPAARQRAPADDDRRRPHRVRRHTRPTATTPSARTRPSRRTCSTAPSRPPARSAGRTCRTSPRPRRRRSSSARRARTGC